MPSTSPAETYPANTPAASQIFTTVLTHGPLTRQEAARRTGLSPAAVTKAVRPLIEAGFLVEDAGAEVRPGLGRPANPVRVDGGRALFIGLKATGDEIIGVLADLCCRIRVARRVPLTGRTPREVLPVAADLVRELLTEAEGFGVQVLGLGIAVAGDVDRAAGTVRFSPFLSISFSKPFTSFTGRVTDPTRSRTYSCTTSSPSRAPLLVTVTLAVSGSPGRIFVLSSTTGE